jgi:hypothetical protein
MLLLMPTPDVLPQYHSHHLLSLAVLQASLLEGPVAAVREHCWADLMLLRPAVVGLLLLLLLLLLMLSQLTAGDCLYVHQKDLCCPQLLVYRL